MSAIPGMSVPGQGGVGLGTAGLGWVRQGWVGRGLVRLGRARRGDQKTGSGREVPIENELKRLLGRPLTYRCLKCGEEVWISPYLQEPDWQRCPNVVNGQRCTARNLYDPKEEKAVDMVDTGAKGSPAPVKEAPTEPKYGPPWKQYQEQCREDTRTLGRAGAMQLWEQRGMPTRNFGHLVPKKLKDKPAPPPHDPAPAPDLQNNPVYLKGKVDAYEYIWRALANGARLPVPSDGRGEA